MWQLHTLPTILFLLIAGALAFADSGESGYEPCHLLCSNEAGRVEAPSSRGPLPLNQFGVRFETAFITPLGHYEDGKYIPMPVGAHAQAIEFLPLFWYRPTENLKFHLGIPWELNRATGVVLPTLHPNEGTTGEFAPAGIIALSAHWRISSQESGPFESWVGIGYKLSSPQGTTDVSDYREFPDKAVEGLGVGSDDLYFPLSAEYGIEKWKLGVGTELRFHMLPRWQRLYALTTAYQAWASYRVLEDWAVTLRFSGYYTALRTLGTSQLAGLIPLTEATWFVSSAVNLSFGLSGEIPGTTLNRNSLQTVRVHSAIALGF